MFEQLPLSLVFDMVPSQPVNYVDVIELLETELRSIQPNPGLLIYSSQPVNCIDEYIWDHSEMPDIYITEIFLI